MTIPNNSTTSAVKTICVGCELEKEIHFSLRLDMLNGHWKTNPVCDNCRGMLIREAKAEGRFIPFFGIEASEKEAAKRNEEVKARRVLVEKFGQKRDGKERVLRTTLFQVALAHR